MHKCLLLLLVVAPLAFAQDTQFGALVGLGGVAKLRDDSAHHVVLGVEGCVRCAGHLGLFLEYHHWTKTGSGGGNPTKLDLAGAGLRIQGTGSRVRPFFDVGGFVGARPRRYFLPQGAESLSLVAVLVGFGAAISVSEHWYVRPMARLGVLSTNEVAGFAGASVGYRF